MKKQTVIRLALAALCTFSAFAVTGCSFAGKVASKALEVAIDEASDDEDSDKDDDVSKDKADSYKKKSRETSDTSKNKKKSGEYDGVWYAQDASGTILTIANGVITVGFNDDDYTDEAEFNAKERDGYTELVIPDDEDEYFYYYEIDYYAGDDAIEAYTWPEDDGDGGYKRTVFWRDEYEAGDTTMLLYLYGDWEIMDDSELIQEPGIKRDRLHFALPQYHTVRFITSDDDSETFNIELADVFDDPGNTYDRLILSNRAGSGKYAWDEVRPQQSFQIMIANNLGGDYMMLRELGDERTGFATDGLRYNRSMQGLWMLRRANPNDYDSEFDDKMTTPSTVGIEDKVRVKGTSFHAIKWMEFGNSCTLQRVETIPTTVEFVGGGPYDALEYCLPDDEYAYSAVNYEYKGMEQNAHGGYFDPSLVYVTTDKEGRIIEMSKLDYAIDGKYYDTGEVVFSK